jgi:hypothetical protein
VSVVLGSKNEVRRVTEYHADMASEKQGAQAGS